MNLPPRNNFSKQRKMLGSAGGFDVFKQWHTE